MSDSIEKKYQQAVTFIYSFVENSRARKMDDGHIEVNLNRMRDLMHDHGDPHLAYPVIHIAGTKGKGSTAAMIASIFQSAGYSVGLYTSPHLQDYSERVQVNGTPISHAKLVDMVEELKPDLQKFKNSTTFEITTAIGFLYFQEKQIDIAIVEVGLGGRLDATNVVEPIVSVITSISLDHTKILGNTIEEIAAEKGGIIKAGTPVVVAKQKEAVYTVLEEIAEQRRSLFFKAADEIPIQEISSEGQGQQFRILKSDYEDPMYVSLLGDYQLENVQSAISVAEICKQKGWNIDQESIRKGLANVYWPGRLEIISYNHLILIDSAHNPYSVMRVLDSVKKIYPEKRIILLFGASRGKEILQMLEILIPECSYCVMSQSVHPKAEDCEELVKLALDAGFVVKGINPIEKALAFCIEKCDTESLILAIGSVFVAAAVRNISGNTKIHLKN
ncbi:MAG: bifunctional folylpolyglutamate synthase/dihydrofolate synthase [Anaerolineaceae bacterium]|nr:bifunctional folylpolyglutamate synthase/dihydrofolate synthase [Anaerolineaceae bacterium]